MFYELRTADYDRVRPLFGAMDYHLAVRAILAGSTPARIYVDHPLRPQAALAWTGHRLYLAGSERSGAFNSALPRLFTGTVRPHALRLGIEMAVLYYEQAGWEPQLGEILEGLAPRQGLRAFYALKEPRYDWRSLLPDGFAVLPVDRALLAEGQLKNLDLLIREICSERPSVEDFLAKSFGLCLLHGDQILGWCLSEYNAAGRCEVGIGVVEAYRRRGLATCLASALVEQARQRGVSQVGWHCWADNRPSVATALKAGFEKVRDYPVFLARFSHTAPTTAQRKSRT